jgi:hypothetical protein
VQTCIQIVKQDLQEQVDPVALFPEQTATSIEHG